MSLWTFIFKLGGWIVMGGLLNAIVSTCAGRPLTYVLLPTILLFTAGWLMCWKAAEKIEGKRTV